MFTKKAMYWDINNEIWELNSHKFSCFSHKKMAASNQPFLSRISETTVAQRHRLSSQLPHNMSMPLLQSGTLTQKFVVVPALRITFDLPSVTPTKHHVTVM